MSLILNIDTSCEIAHVSLGNNGLIVASLSNKIQKDHAAFLHPAIKCLLETAETNVKELDAIAVTSGPGSYTGIRVGMASAKGLCVALGIPFITINTLQLLSKDAIMHYPLENNILFCPMVDARRMEVYTALYDANLNEIVKATAMILDANAYHAFPNNYTFINFGCGAIKWESVVKLRNVISIKNVNVPAAMALLSQERYKVKSFADVVYSQPLYVKEFHDSRI